MIHTIDVMCIVGINISLWYCVLTCWKRPSQCWLTVATNGQSLSGMMFRQALPFKHSSMGIKSKENFSHIITLPLLALHQTRWFHGFKPVLLVPNSDARRAWIFPTRQFFFYSPKIQLWGFCSQQRKTYFILFNHPHNPFLWKNKNSKDFVGKILQIYNI